MSWERQTSQPQPGPRRGKGYPSTVQVFANHDGTGWQFHMHHDNRPAEELHFSKDEKKLKKSDWHDIVFELEEPTNSIQFHPEAEQAIWVARGSKSDKPECPTAPSQDPLGGFYAKRKPEPKRLLVCNNNDEECYLSYRLNFVAFGSSDNRIVAFHDPVVGNKNGGIDD